MGILLILTHEETKTARVKSEPFDLIVIGAGPAGLSAAAEAAGAGLKTLILDKLGPGGALINLGCVHGVPDTPSGPWLVGTMTDDVTAAGAELGFAEVTRIAGGDPWTVETAEGEMHAGRALIVATGLTEGQLGLSGEETWEGRGLSHCASCDGPLFTGQPVVVVGGDGWAAHEAVELAGLADHVTMVNPGGTDAPKAANISAMAGRVVALEGANGLESVIVEQAGVRQSIPANAIFVYIGQSPAAEFVTDSLARDGAGHIVVDDDGNTSKPLVFAVGDVASGVPHSVEEARHSGERAARAIVARLRSTK